MVSIVPLATRERKAAFLLCLATVEHEHDVAKHLALAEADLGLQPFVDPPLQPLHMRLGCGRAVADDDGRFSVDAVQAEARERCVERSEGCRPETGCGIAIHCDELCDAIDTGACEPCSNARLLSLSRLRHAIPDSLKPVRERVAESRRLLVRPVRRRAPRDDVGGHGTPPAS